MIEKTVADSWLKFLADRFKAKIDPKEYYLSYSGGKDSHLLYWFIKEWLRDDDIVIVGTNTGFELPEIRNRIMKNCDVVLHPVMHRKELKEKFGIPCFSKQQDEYIYRYQHGSRTRNTMNAVLGENTIFKLNNKARNLLLSDKPSCFLVVENLQDPGNLGTMIRTGEGAGITGLILDRQSVDPYHLKVIRSTMGAIFRLPIVIAEDLPKACRQLKEAGVTLYAGHLEGEPLYRTDLTDSCAFLIGNEGKGLSSGIMEEADRGIRIPMKGHLESLNAAVASTVLMYEVLRQRDWK